MFSSIPPVTRTLILACVAMFALQSLAGERFYLYLALWPLGSSALGESGFMPWQLISYSFLHGSFMHLLVNMYALYMFGSELERLFGERRFLQLYMVSVVAAALVQLLLPFIAPTQAVLVVGASGGVFGLLLAYGVYFPHRTVVLLIPPIPLPARVFVILYGALELYLGVTGTQEGVAHFAHLGGMLGAWLLIRRWRGRAPRGW